MRYFAVTLIRSGAGRQQTQRQTLAGLGLRRLHQVVYRQDTPAVRGMLYKLAHLLKVEACEGEMPASTRMCCKKMIAGEHNVK